MQSSDISPWVSIAKDGLVGLSAIFATAIAYSGLDAWRKELKGRSEYELAKKVLQSTYRVREAFKHVRGPMIFQYEYPKEMTDARGHLKPEHDYDGTVHVYETRWKKLDEAFQELEDYHLAAQVEWGPSFQDVIKNLRKCRVELMIAIRELLDRKKNPREIAPSTAEERSREQSVLYHLGGDSKYDKFTPEIDGAIEEFERWLRPHIRGGH